MPDQLGIEWERPKIPPRLCNDPLSIADRARAFHSANPHVYRLFERYTLEAIRSGKDKLGAKAVWERLRWDLHLQTVGEPVKLNNNYTAWYAREFVRRHPEHADVFSFRGRG